MKQAQEASETLFVESDTSLNADRIKIITEEIGALKGLLSGLVPASDELVNGSSPPKNAALTDEADLITSNEYGSVIKMTEKFSRMKSNLQEQIERLKDMAAKYRASRDEALKSADESRDICQRLRDEIESMKSESETKIKRAVRDHETYRANEFAACQTETNEIKEKLARREDELRKKTAESEGLKTKLISEKKRLLAYKMDRFEGEGEMNPVVKKLIERTDKEQAALKDRIEELSHILSKIKSRNTSLEEALQEEKERHERYLDLTNSVPAMKRRLDEARKAAEHHRCELEAAKACIDALNHELQAEKHAKFDIENGETEAKHLIATLSSELQDQKEEAEKRAADLRGRLEVEVARHKAKAAEFRREYSELLRRQEELANEVAAESPGEGKSAVLFNALLNQRASLLEELRALRDKHAATLSDSEYVKRQAKESSEELFRLQQTESRLRDEHAAALLELESVQWKLDRTSAELQDLKDRTRREEETRRDPDRVWEDTPVGMSKEFLESRIEMLQENLVKTLRAACPPGLTDDAGYYDGPGIKDHSELIDTVKRICGSWSPSDGSLKSALTKADMVTFEHQRDLQNKKLILLRAIKDRDWARGYKAMEALDKFLQETDLGATTDEAWGSVQYLHAYFHLYVANDVVAAQAAARRAREHGPERWERKFYRDIGAKLEADLQNRTAGEHRQLGVARRHREFPRSTSREK